MAGDNEARTFASPREDCPFRIQSAQALLEFECRL
jgi:hypothetical protein